MTIPFIKAQGAGNDFLLTWEAEAPTKNRAEVARAICSRHLGVGADGWYLVRRGDAAGTGIDAAIHLYNSDGSEAELSGNGTRCVAAMLIDAGLAGERVRIQTGAGLRELRMIESDGRRFRFEMNMGQPVVRENEIQRQLPLKSGPLEVTTLNVGNPQCVVFVDEFPGDWETTAAEIEGHGHFPNRTNVSFVKVVDRHTVDARFFERGAGVTISSGTGSMGAAVAAIVRKKTTSPVRVLTALDPLEVTWKDDVFLEGPAQIVATGSFYWPED